MINRNLKHIFTILVILTILVPISGTASANPNSPQADPIYVDTTEDHYEVTPDGDCSLREAITTINNGSGFGGCPYPAGATNIELTEGATYILSIDGAGEDSNVTGDLDILVDMTIQGMNSTVTALYLTDRVLMIHVGVTVTINDLTIEEGSSVNMGGGIYNRGYLTLNDSIVQNNVVTTGGGGGGIESAWSLFNPRPSLTLNRSTIRYNSGDYGGGLDIFKSDFFCDESSIGINQGYYGGGMLIYTEADDIDAMITRCEILGNSATLGGGIFNAGKTLIEYSIIGGNFAAQSGGNIYNGILTPGDLAADLYIVRTLISNGYAFASDGGGVMNTSPSNVSIRFSTIAVNTSNGYGGGVANIGEFETGSFTIDHTTIAENYSGLSGSAISMRVAEGGLIPMQVLIANSIIAGTCNYPVTGESYANLETGNTCNLDTSPGYGNYVNTPANFASNLQYNGSKFLVGVDQFPTYTYALQPTSLAVDHADCALYTEDQRGYPLDVDGDGDGNPQCDMGSYELQRFSFLPFLKKP